MIKPYFDFSGNVNDIQDIETHLESLQISIESNMKRYNQGERSHYDYNNYDRLLERDIEMFEELRNNIKQGKATQLDNNQTFTVDVTWRMQGKIAIKAKTLEEAQQIAINNTLLPLDGNYVKNSLRKT